MGIDQQALATLIAKEEIRQLVLLYSRGVDRKDIDLLRTLYAKDATDDHGQHFKGTAGDYMHFLERSFPHMRMSGHYVCNHLISVNGDEAEGEVYASPTTSSPTAKAAPQRTLRAFAISIATRRKVDAGCSPSESSSSITAAIARSRHP